MPVFAWSILSAVWCLVAMWTAQLLWAKGRGWRLLPAQLLGIGVAVLGPMLLVNLVDGEVPDGYVYLPVMIMVVSAAGTTAMMVKQVKDQEPASR